jgi:hypothetical protein
MAMTEPMLMAKMVRIEASCMVGVSSCVGLVLFVNDFVESVGLV